MELWRRSEGGCLLPLSLCKPLVLAVVLKTALSCASEAPCERDLTERRKRILQHREQGQAHVDLLLLACRHRPLVLSGFSSVVLPNFESTNDKFRQLYPPRLV
jgi:arginase family enzyme